MVSSQFSESAIVRKSIPMDITSVLTPKAVMLATYCPSGLERRVQITIHQNMKTTDLKPWQRLIMIK